MNVGLHFTKSNLYKVITLGIYEMSFATILTNSHLL